MFKRLLEKLSGPRKPPPRATVGKQQLTPQQEALFRQIREHSTRDPLVGAKLGAKEVYHRVFTALRNEKGVHIESLLCILGSLAGYACQAQLRAQAFRKMQPESSVFQVVTTADGTSYYFGDPLNHLLVGAQYSIWSLAGGGAAHLDATGLPDPAELFKHTASAIGSEQFGIPRLPGGHQLPDRPLNFVKAFWPKLFPTIKLFCPNPAHWPILAGLAAQHAISASEGVIAPELAFTIVLESAIPMSKVDLANA
jgi:hypothetical protein